MKTKKHDEWRKKISNSQKERWNKLKTKKQLRNEKIGNVIFFTLIGLAVCLLISAEIESYLDRKETMGDREIKQLFCQSEGGSYIEFNETDYCYGDILNGLVLIEIKEECYQEELCTFKFKE